MKDTHVLRFDSDLVPPERSSLRIYAITRGFFPLSSSSREISVLLLFFTSRLCRGLVFLRLKDASALSPKRLRPPPVVAVGECATFDQS